MDAKAEIEKIIRVHSYHGFHEQITIKDNPDAPDIGAVIIHECEGDKIEVYIWKEDITQIIKALQMFNEKETK